MGTRGSTLRRARSKGSMASLILQGLPDLATAVRAQALLTMALGNAPQLRLEHTADDNYEIWAVNAPGGTLSTAELHAQVFGGLIAFVIGEGPGELAPLVLAVGAPVPATAPS